ncbi:MAG: hypothetical protein PHI97_04550 [Desulfobulbus sp.]|nr:hypothetical protein [Desulfobulbus sp.]
MDTKIPEAIQKSLAETDRRYKGLLNMSSAMMKAYDGAMYPVDLLATGIIKRTVSNIHGFKLLVESQNMVCARTLLRTQIDSALRFYAVFLVTDPHAFSLKVLDGKQINQMKDSSGNIMRDSYLVKKLTKDYPWMKDVYHNLSGYIHFSNSHIFNAVSPSENDNAIKINIQPIDTKYPVESWVEVVDCFNESIDIFAKYLEGWIITKKKSRIS